MYIIEAKDTAKHAFHTFTSSIKSQYAYCSHVTYMSYLALVNV